MSHVCICVCIPAHFSVFVAPGLHLGRERGPIRIWQILLESARVLVIKIQ